MAITQPSDLRPGDVLLIGAASAETSVPVRLHLINVLDRDAGTGRCYLDGRVLDANGTLAQRKTLLVPLSDVIREDHTTRARVICRLANNRGHRFRPLRPIPGGSPA